MNDPIQMLIDVGAIPSSPFVPHSRYSGVPLGLFVPSPGLPGIVYVLRRFVRAPDSFVPATVHRVVALDRPDRLAAQFLGDSLLDWQIADANAVMELPHLTDTPGRRVVIPQL